MQNNAGYNTLLSVKVPENILTILLSSAQKVTHYAQH